MEPNSESRSGPSTLWSTNIRESRKDSPWKKNSLFNKWCWEYWTSTCRRRIPGHSLTSHTKINSKRMKDLNVRQESIQIREATRGNTLFQLGHSNISQDTSAKARETKATRNYWDFTQIESFCIAKETVHKSKRQPTEREKIFANDRSDSALLSKVYKEHTQLKSKETYNLIMKPGKDTHRNFTEEDRDSANKHMRRCPALLAIRELQIQTTIRYHRTPVIMGKSHKTGNHKCWRGCGQRGTLLHCRWECELVQLLEEHWKWVITLSEVKLWSYYWWFALQRNLSEHAMQKGFGVAICLRFLRI